MGQELAKAVIQPLVKPLNSCCLYVLNDCEWASNCGCCSCKIATHAIAIDDENDDPQ